MQKIKKKKDFIGRIRRAYRECVPPDWRPSEIWYWFTCWIWHRYTTIKARTLPHTWIDRDTVLEHTMFEILCLFIEREKPDEHFNMEESNHKEEWVKLFALYRWWKDQYIPAYNSGKEEPLEKELNEKLHELLDLRHMLWT